MLSEERWNQLLMRLCGVPPKRDAFRQITAAYSAPERLYHNSQHIIDCLSELDEARHLAESPYRVEYALWLHDVYYRPGAGDNEEKSAEWARRILVDLGCHGSIADAVSSLIMATSHKRNPATPDEELIIDIDLSILGQKPETFDRYEKGIRAEYSWLSYADYSEGRTKILSSFLNRRRIYFSDWFERKYGAQARNNLTRALAALKRL